MRKKPAACFEALLADPRSHVRPLPASVPLSVARDAADARLALAPRREVARVQQVSIAAEGRQIPARLYHPTGNATLPVIVFLHGGGWVWGSLDSHDSVARSLALESGCAVLSVGYRLAPEAPYPAALDDVAATLDWIPGAAREFGLDDTRVALCGDSSGANLAIVTALNSPTKLRHLGLVYPPLDPTCSTPSQDLYAKDHLLTQEGMLWFWDLYQQGATAPRVLEADLSGLPPVSIALAECDVLHDEGAALHARLQEAGVPSRLRVYEGMIHAFISLPHITPVANVAISEMARDIAASLQQEPAE